MSRIPDMPVRPEPPPLRQIREDGRPAPPPGRLYVNGVLVTDDRAEMLRMVRTVVYLTWANVAITAAGILIRLFVK